MFDIQKYQKASSAAEAVALLAKDPAAKLICGGTDVLIKLREFDAAYGNLVDIHGVPELKNIDLLPDGTIRVGAGASFTAISESPVICEHLPMLGEAAASVAGPQIRNVGTIGGNLCNGAVSADTCAPVLALDGQMRVLGVDGERLMPARGFHTGPGKVALKTGDVLLSVDFPKATWQGWGSFYTKYAMRDAMDIATIGCAAAVRLQGDVIADLRLAYAVAAPTPVRCPAAEAVGIGQPLNEATLKAVAEAVEADVSPRTSWRANKDFRLHIIRTLAVRVVKAAAERSGK